MPRNESRSKCRWARDGSAACRSRRINRGAVSQEPEVSEPLCEPSGICRRDFLTGLACSAVGVGMSKAASAQADKAEAPLIDTHMHVWSGDPQRFPFAHPYEPNVKPPPIAATLELLRKEMDDAGVSHCVLVQTIYHGWDNRYLAECLKADPVRFRGH